MTRFSKQLPACGLIVLVVLCTLMAVSEAKISSWSYHHKTFKEAAQSDSFIQFKLIHRKLGGLLASSFIGEVKNFSITGDLNQQLLHHAKVTMNTQSLDTNNTMRNTKMQTDCLKASAFPQIEVQFNEPLHLGSQTVPAFINILGHSKPITILVNITEFNDHYLAKGNSRLSFSGLNVPKPKFIAENIASMDDTILVNFQATLPK